jgi:hypothetical protein
MFRRVESESLPLPLGKEWIDQFKQTLLNLYGDKCLKHDRTFEIYAYTYPEEVLLIVSYVSLDKFVSPVTLFLSTDLSNSSKPEKTLDLLCDSVGIFFDHYFASSSDQEDIFDEYVYEWEEEEISNSKIFYKITRENIALTMEANRLLGDLE